MSTIQPDNSSPPRSPTPSCRAPSGNTPFGTRMAAAMETHGPLCVGIDPHAALLEAWGLDDTAAGVREFSLRVVDALGGKVAALKPQAAFYERHGSAGIAALEDTLAAARAADTLTIVDAKRGDIGSTMAAYADAYLRDGSPLAGDALTVSPYLGFASLQPAITRATSSGRGLFVLCLTSNPEGKQIQHAHTGPTPDNNHASATIASTIASQAATFNAGRTPMGSIGLVVGATIDQAAATTNTNLVDVNGPLLAPGIGAQGAGAPELTRVFGAARRNVLASSSRGVLRAGPDKASLQRAARETVHALYL